MTILKQLIENMIGDYLNESYEDDLVESIFEEVSSDTWKAIEEAILNELSPELLSRYREKSLDSRVGSYYDSNNADNPEKRDAAKQILKKRTSFQGISKTKYKDAHKNKNVDYRNLSADEFEKKYRQTKSQWKDDREDLKASNPDVHKNWRIRR